MTRTRCAEDVRGSGIQVMEQPKGDNLPQAERYTGDLDRVNVQAMASANMGNTSATGVGHKEPGDRRMSSG
jgi:hypothetical protein